MMEKKINLDDFAKAVTIDTLPEFIERVSNEADPKYDRREILLRMAAEALELDYQEFRQKYFPEPDLVMESTAQENNPSLTFPDIMSGAAGDFAEVYSHHMEPPKHFFYMAYLTCLGNVLTKRLIINSEISPEPRYYIVIIGESADDRKSTAINKTTAFFEEAIPDFSVCNGVGSAEGL